MAKEAKPLTYRNAMLQEKAADLIDHSRWWPTDGIAPGAVLVDQVDRRSSLERSVSTAAEQPPRWRVGVSEVVLVALPERFGISGRYLLYVMAERT